mmetsp:Transcript_96502/g.258043  ORF Transcript_96502/g.258043 Transcript_96502/m.258043 type:complete len:105 (+) Transcript_96502:29-343(+)
MQAWFPLVSMRWRAGTSRNTVTPRRRTKTTLKLRLAAASLRGSERPGGFDSGWQQARRDITGVAFSGVDPRLGRCGSELAMHPSFPSGRLRFAAECGCACLENC